MKAPSTLPALGGQNLLDKAIAYAMPGLAVKRQAQRNQLALSGGYTGARIDKAQLSRWYPSAGSPNTDTIRDLPILRARSRDQMRNAPVALGALNTTVSHVVGTGLSYTPAINAEYLGLDDEQAEAWQDDTKRRFNRTENLRQIPQTAPDFKRLYRRRNDAESINRALESELNPSAMT